MKIIKWKENNYDESSISYIDFFFHEYIPENSEFEIEWGYWYIDKDGTYDWNETPDDSSEVL